MQDPAIYDQMKPQFPEHEHLKCPRCDSANTKFCYYNNYNLSQPRYFCKNCRRYWTKGGALRNIPVGGGCRKNTKRSSKPKRPANSEPDRIRKQPESSVSSAAPTLAPQGIQISPLEPDPTRPYGFPGITGSFSSLLSASNEQFGIGNLLDGLNPNGSGLKTGQMRDFGMNSDAGHDLNADLGQDPRIKGSNNGENYGEDSSCWGGGSSGWPDLAIYTPSSNFQ